MAGKTSVAVEGLYPLKLGYESIFIYIITSGFWPRVRARALRAPVVLGALQCPGALRAPRPLQLRCFMFIGQKIYYFQKLKHPSGPSSTEPPRLRNITFPAPRPTCRTLLSYAASYCASLHPKELCCTLLSYLHPLGLRCTLLSYTAPY